MLNNSEIHFLLFLSYISRFITCFYDYTYKSMFKQNIKKIVLNDELDVIK